MHILIAEDDVISNKVLHRILSEAGHNVASFDNGHSALEHFRTSPTPVVISDWMMPRMDGLELCRHVRALNLPEYTHFILLTAREGHQSYREAMDNGVDDFLTKPVNKEQLLIKLRVAERVVRQRQEAEGTIRALARFPEDNPNPVLKVDRDGRILYANRACAPLLTQWQCQLGDTAPEQIRELVESLCRSGRRQEIEMICDERVLSFSATSISEEGVAYLYGHDITDRKRAENELIVLKNQAEANSLHDQLTGLPNRRLLTDRLAQEALRAQRLKQKLALVIVDIDNFKQINDGYGHEIGDRVIVTVGHCLRDTLRGTDTVCRWGGDEMVLLLPGLTEHSQVATICGKLCQAVKQRVVEAGLEVPVTLSLGSALFPDDSSDTAE